MALDSNDGDFTRPSSGGGGGDATSTTYTPSNGGAWQGAPASVQAALDELANRVLALEGDSAPLQTTSFTSGVARSLFDVSVGTKQSKAGVVSFAIYASNGTDQQSYVGKLYWSAVRKGATITTDLRIVADTPSFAESDNTKTLDVQGAFDTSVPATATLKLTVTTSLAAPTVHSIQYRRVDLGSDAPIS